MSADAVGPRTAPIQRGSMLARVLLLALALAHAGCAAPDRGELGLLPTSEVGDRFASVPVARLMRMPSGAGNAVVLGEDTIITVAHAATGDDEVYTLDGQTARFHTLARGREGETFHRDWCLARVSPTGLSHHSPLPIVRTVPLGTEIFVVGYWAEPRAGLRDADRELVAVRGRVIEPPLGMADAAAGLLCVDLGDPPRDWRGLSGSPAVVETDSGLALIGILAGYIHWTLWPLPTLTETHCVVPIPEAARDLGE